MLPLDACCSFGLLAYLVVAAREIRPAFEGEIAVAIERVVLVVVDLGFSDPLCCRERGSRGRYCGSRCNASEDASAGINIFHRGDLVIMEKNQERVGALQHEKKKSINFDLGGLVAFFAFSGVIVSIIFVYTYLQMMGRSDLFVDVVAGGNVTSYILALGSLFGFLAFLVFVLPSYMLIVANDFSKTFVPNEKMSGLHVSLMFSCGAVIFLMVVAVVCAAYTKIDNLMNYSMSVLVVLCLALSYYWFKRRYYQPSLKSGERRGWKNYKLPALLFCLMLAFLIFYSSVYTYVVAKVVLELRSWEDNVGSLIMAFSLSTANMLATLIPAALYFVSFGNKTSKRMAAFSIGFFLFVAVLVFSVPKVMDVARYNVARVIGANDANIWVYKVVDKKIGAIFSYSSWDGSYDAKSNELTAKLLYGMGGMKVLCPKDAEIDVRKESYVLEDSMNCVLVDHEKVVKVKPLDKIDEGENKFDN